MNYCKILACLLLAVVPIVAGCDPTGSQVPASADKIAGKIAGKTVLLATITDEAVQQPSLPSLGMGLHEPQAPSRQA